MQVSKECASSMLIFIASHSRFDQHVFRIPRLVRLPVLVAKDPGASNVGGRRFSKGRDRAEKSASASTSSLASTGTYIKDTTAESPESEHWRLSFPTLLADSQLAVSSGMSDLKKPRQRATQDNSECDFPYHAQGWSAIRLEGMISGLLGDLSCSSICSDEGAA